MIMIFISFYLVNCEKLRPDLGGIETIKIIIMAATVITSEKLRPDLGGIETEK